MIGRIKGVVEGRGGERAMGMGWEGEEGVRGEKGKGVCGCEFGSVVDLGFELEGEVLLSGKAVD